MSKYSSLPPSTTVNGVTESCHVVVRNRTQSVLRLCWIDFQGGAQEYAQIQPEKNYVCNTFSTHTWVMEDPHGNIMGHYQGMLLYPVVNVVSPGHFVKLSCVLEYMVQDCDTKQIRCQSVFITCVASQTCCCQQFKLLCTLFGCVAFPQAPGYQF
jgi:hypothetical protein